MAVTRPSPAFAINGGTVGFKASLDAATTYTATLDSIVGVAPVTWTVSRVDDFGIVTDYTGAPAWLQSGSVGQTVAFGSLAPGTAGVLKATVAGGTDPVTDTPNSELMSAEVKFYVPTVDGKEVAVAGEQNRDDFVSNPTHGVIELLNAVVRSGLRIERVNTTLSAAGPTDILQYDAADDTCVLAVMITNARDVTSGDSAQYFTARQYENSAGTLTALGAEVVIIPAQEEDAGWACAQGVTGDKVTIAATSDAANDVNWSVWLFIFEVAG